MDKGGRRMSKENNEVHELLKDTIDRFISPDAQMLNIESKPIGMGLQAVELLRHNVKLKVNDEETNISLVTKKATLIERSTLSRLYSQSANVPFSLSNNSITDGRSLICIQDVDYQTDYSKLDIEMLQKKELQSLAYIHRTNMGFKEELSWVPSVDRTHIIEMINRRWKPSWEAPKENTAFIEEFGSHIISKIEDVANSIVNEISAVIDEESTHTLIHNDLNPGNVLVHNNEDVYFIDWEEARYGSLFFDIPLRCSNLKQIRDYRDFLGPLGIEIPQARFEELFSIASRYLGVRYMSWNLSVWHHNQQAKDGLKKYIGMVTNPLFS